RLPGPRAAAGLFQRPRGPGLFLPPSRAHCSEDPGRGESHRFWVVHVVRRAHAAAHLGGGRDPRAPRRVGVAGGHGVLGRPVRRLLASGQGHKGAESGVRLRRHRRAPCQRVVPGGRPGQRAAQVPGAAGAARLPSLSETHVSVCSPRLAAHAGPPGGGPRGLPAPGAGRVRRPRLGPQQRRRETAAQGADEGNLPRRAGRVPRQPSPRRPPRRAVALHVQPREQAQEHGPHALGRAVLPRPTALPDAATVVRDRGAGASRARAPCPSRVVPRLCARRRLGPGLLLRRGRGGGGLVRAGRGGRRPGGSRGEERRLRQPKPAPRIGAAGAVPKPDHAALEGRRLSALGRSSAGDALLRPPGRGAARVAGGDFPGLARPAPP
ncbi:hypothetical protein H632_c3693p0, partial [Helicosporidium sp. ATCC 50920]